MTKKLLLALALPAVVVACAGAAIAASSGEATIKGCVDKKGALRIANTCKKGETALAWNQKGPAGANGAAGPAGPQGPAAPEKASTALKGFLKLDGVTGEATDPQHVGEIDVDSFAINAKNIPATAGGGGGGAGKVEFGNVRFTKRFDAASPTLLLRTATGQHLAVATFSLKAAKESVTYKLSDVTVVDYD